MDPRLQSYIATRDRRIEGLAPWKRASLSECFAQLVSGRIVTVGGRASCGGRVDPTWVEFIAWNEIVRKAKSLGYGIEVTSIKHGNGWATKCGGFWNENDYRLTKAPKDHAPIS